MGLAAEIDPRFVDLALALVALEAVGLVAYYAATGRGPSPIGTIANLLAGGFLILMLREMLGGLGPGWIIASLSAALVAHAVDLVARWRGGSANTRGPRITRGAISLRATRNQQNPAPKTPECKTPELGRPHA